MRINIILFVTFFLVEASCFSQTPTNKFQWLKSNIETKSYLFTNKPLQVLLDSLKEIKGDIRSYRGPVMYKVGLNDSIFIESIHLYFGNFDSAFAIHWGNFDAAKNDTLNTHIPVLQIKFSWPVLYLRKWWSQEPESRGSDKWIKVVEDLYKNEYIAEVKVKEY